MTTPRPPRADLAELQRSLLRAQVCVDEYEFEAALIFTAIACVRLSHLVDHDKVAKLLAWAQVQG